MSERRIVSDLSKVSLGDNDNEEEILEQIKHLQQKLLKHREKSTQPSSESSFPGHQEERAQRLLVIANRLPVTLKHDAKSGEWNFKMSSGGLVSALMGVKNFEMVWVGWPGSYVDDVEQQEIIEDKLGELNCVPVWMNEGNLQQFLSMLFLNFRY